MIEILKQLDQDLFLFLNGMNNPVFDQIMWFVSGKLEWIPLYLLLIYFLAKSFGKSTWFILIGIIILITASDQLSVHAFKEVFERYRPCHNLDIQDLVHRVNNKCGGQFGFVSSHASNSFAVAVMMGLLLKNKYRYIFSLLIFWAILLSYSRIYLGVHYPADVIGGALLGSALAYIVYKVLRLTALKNKL